MTQTPNRPDASQERRSEAVSRWTGRRSRTRSRVGGVWVTSILFAVVLLLLLIFVLQNGQRVRISYLGTHGELPMGVALLLAAVFGVLLVALPGTARIMQLHMRDRRRRAAASTSPPTPTAPTPGPSGPGTASAPSLASSDTAPEPGSTPPPASGTPPAGASPPSADRR